MEIGCADCGCVVDRGERLIACDNPACCCAHLALRLPATGDATPSGMAERIRTALASADLEAFRELLDADVRWGAPGDPSPACQSRNQVLAWYTRGRDGGVRAEVTEVAERGDKVLVGLRVRPAGDRVHEAEDRWQVLTLVADRVIDIRGYDDRRQASEAAGILG